MRLKLILTFGAMLGVFVMLFAFAAMPAASIHAQTGSTPTPTATPIPDDAHTEAFADFLILRYDPLNKIIYIEPIHPSIRIVIGNQAAGNAAIAPVTTTPAPTPTAAPLDATKLRGKIIFKSTRENGEYPNEFLYYLMNPDGTDAQRVDTGEAKKLLNVIQGLEGFSPDRTQVVMGDRACGSYIENDCRLYILTPAQHAQMIFSDEEPSQGEWFGQKNVKAKEPVWSPRGDYIVFASNHEAPDGCHKTMNLFKATAKQNPVIQRLTAYCAGGDTGRPSFSPDGGQVVYWTQFPGPNRDVYILDIAADDSIDWRSLTPKRITFEGDNWDPIWIK